MDSDEQVYTLTLEAYPDTIVPGERRSARDRATVGIVVTDGSAVPRHSTVEPAPTISALAERAIPGIAATARERGVDVPPRRPAADHGRVPRPVAGAGMR